MTIAPPLARRDPFAAAMALLNSGVPLSLLLDLALGPCSEKLLDEERVTTSGSTVR